VQAPPPPPPTTNEDTSPLPTEIDWSDPYTLIDSPLFPGYAEHLRQLGAFDGLGQ
jgi:hypothetical protein